MKKKKVALFSTRFFQFGNSLKAISITLMLFFLISCTNDKKKVAGAGKANETIGCDFPYLTMDKTKLDNFFVMGTPTPNKEADKMVFRFQFDSCTSTPSLLAYTASSVRTFDPVLAKKTIEKSIFSKPLGGEFCLGNLELTRAQYDILKTDGGYGAATVLIFSPKLSGTDVVYELSWSPKKFHDLTKQDFISITGIGGADLNPSPPKTPEGSN